MIKNKSNAKFLMLSNWDEVDLRLRRIGEIQIALEKIEGDMTLRINDIRQDYKESIGIFESERRDLEEAITSFSEMHKDEFTKTRSKELNFGLVAYRVVRKIMIRSNEACVAALRALKLDQYIRVTEEPNKEAMADLEDNQLAKVGAKRKVEDKFRIEPNIERIKEL